jgi:ER lumen protein retaining receptor
VLLWLVVEDHDNLFIMSEVVHFSGLGFLIFKLQSKKNCAGLSLRTQELTALFLAVRLYCRSAHSSTRTAACVCGSA